MPNDTSASFHPIEWRDGAIRFLDQTLLPREERYVETDDYAAIAGAVRRLAIRGAPLIGIAAAYALALAARAGIDLAAAASELRATRPTAMNLAWALERVLAATDGVVDRAAIAEAEALVIHEEQIAADVRMSELGAALIDDGTTILTHCNAGSLATGGIGSALGVLKTAHWQGKRIRVLVDETRPLLQGARLTAWELAREGIAHQVIVDAAAAGLIARGGVQAIVAGADRISANGDIANKVGTYGLALAAREHGVPLYVAAPASTIDVNTACGADIAIEERGEDEVLSLASQRTAPDGTRARNPAFDVTPAALVTAIITEHGILHAPYGDAIAGIMRATVAAR